MEGSLLKMVPGAMIRPGPGGGSAPVGKNRHKLFPGSIGSVHALRMRCAKAWRNPRNLESSGQADSRSFMPDGVKFDDHVKLFSLRFRTKSLNRVLMGISIRRTSDLRGTNGLNFRVLTNVPVISKKSNLSENPKKPFGRIQTSTIFIATRSAVPQDPG